MSLSYTLCGSPEFMAPECVLGLGCDKRADWWAFGCVAYEMHVGRNPFEHGDNEQSGLKQTYLDIAAIGLRRSCVQLTPEIAAQPAVALFLGRLLSPVMERLVHPSRDSFFVGFDFGALRAKSMPAQFVPHLEHDADMRYFPVLSASPDEQPSPLPSSPEAHAATDEVRPSMYVCVCVVCLRACARGCVRFLLLGGGALLPRALK